MNGRQETALSALTLLEVLVVTAIIAVLVAIFISVPTDLTVVVCQSNLRQIGVAIRMYATENREYAPFIGEMPHDHPRHMLKTPKQLLGTYLDNE